MAFPYTFPRSQYLADLQTLMYAGAIQVIEPEENPRLWISPYGLEQAAAQLVAHIRTDEDRFCLVHEGILCNDAGQQLDDDEVARLLLDCAMETARLRPLLTAHVERLVEAEFLEDLEQYDLEARTTPPADREDRA